MCFVQRNGEFGHLVTTTDCNFGPSPLDCNVLWKNELRWYNSGGELSPKIIGLDVKMESRRSLSFLVPMALLALMSLTACSNGTAVKAKGDGGGPEKDKAMSVSIVPVESRELRRTVESVGSLFAYDEVVVSSEVDGRADKVLVDVGDKVTKGQTLVEIAPIEFKLAADQQEALLEEARAKLGLAEGADLTDPTQAAGVKKAAADLANAKQKFQRTKDLADQGLLPKQNYDQDESTYKAAQATYDLSIQDVRNLQAALKSGVP